MPNLIVAGSVVEVRAFAYMINQLAVNRVRYRCASIVGAGVTDSDFATLMSTSLEALYKDVMSASANFIGVQCQILRPTRLPEVTEQADFGPGLNAGDPLPPQTAALISFKTNSATRAGRGRIYIPFLSETTANPDGRPSAVQIAALEALATVWATTKAPTVGADTSNMVPVIASADGLLPKDITDFRVRPYWATMRRRSFANRPDVLPF